MSVLDRSYFYNEKAAFRHLEGLLWGDGVICPKCGTVDRAGRLEGVKGKNGKERLGLWKCYECRKQFTVRVGTVFESAHIPLHKCLQAVHLMVSSKKGISAHQLHRTLEITYKSAWFLAHRIREAMRDGQLSPLGGNGKTIEIDETYIGRLEGVPKQRSGGAHKNIVMTLVERGGAARSFHIDSTTLNEVTKIVRENVNRESVVNTDEGRWYGQLGAHFMSHDAVNHSREEYVRYSAGDKITTNTVEGYYSIFKRGMKGV
ncbi:DDE transposase [Bradyrhizobium iriomotense]|uniref:DDE transposase n=1 Tax=Bradyrhizobium iriomotense TaxID=441950 RepID=A0ABQ6B7D2_9BRAD|nr:DDE transposase [Bradyrhizobium iriomotense]